jgi:Ankyrin repeats (many copies)
VYLAAAAFGHVHVLQRLRELECAWDSAKLCTLAAMDGLLNVLQWAKQQGAVFTEDTVMLAAAHGQTAVCEYLHAQQCPRDAAACYAAAHCHVDTLRWLLEHGFPCKVNSLWMAATQSGHISVLHFLQQIALVATPADASLALFIAGAHSQLAAAQWLRAYGAEWPAVLSMAVNGQELQWGGAVLEGARAEGCTSPLE